MSTTIEIKGQDLFVTRVFPASIEAVFEAWIETSKIAQWWGCAECTNVESEIEAKVGGKYNHHMTIETEHGVHHAPGFATLIEFDPPNRLAYRSEDDNDPMVVTVDFTTIPGGTEVRLRHTNIPDTLVDGDIKLDQVISGGWRAACPASSI